MKISVVIPAYNEEKYLSACLDAIFAQARPADEVIVVDNRSTDATAKVAQKYNVRLVHESQQGIMPAVYAGFSAATGDIIARCDADSIVPPDWLATIERALSDRPNAVAVTGPGKFYGTNRVVAAAAQLWYMYAYFGLVGLALANWPLFGSNCAVRRSAWLAAAPHLHKTRTDIHDDIDISMHLSAKDRVVLLPRMVVGISARSLRLSGLQKRYARGFTSLYIHWPSEAPWRRWPTKIRYLLDN